MPDLAESATGHLKINAGYAGKIFSTEVTTTEPLRRPRQVRPEPDAEVAGFADQRDVAKDKLHLCDIDVEHGRIDIDRHVRLLNAFFLDRTSKCASVGADAGGAHRQRSLRAVKSFRARNGMMVVAETSKKKEAPAMPGGGMGGMHY